MRIPVLLMLFPLLAAGPALAQSTPQQNQNSTSSQNTQAIRQQVQKNLQDAGFTDIKIMPSSFLVRAKDKDGNPVMMVINPDSVTAVTEIPAQGSQTSGQGASSSKSSAAASSSGSSTSK